MYELRVSGRSAFDIQRKLDPDVCELPERALENLPRVEAHEHDPIEAVERTIAGMPNPPAIEHAGTKAFYSSTADRITMPPRNLFRLSGRVLINCPA
jgi:antirestriction protein ArdC